jgi:hypothetical protein
MKINRTHYVWKTDTIFLPSSLNTTQKVSPIHIFIPYSAKGPMHRLHRKRNKFHGVPPTKDDKIQ